MARRLYCRDERLPILYLGLPIEANPTIINKALWDNFLFIYYYYFGVCVRERARIGEWFCGFLGATR